MGSKSTTSSSLGLFCSLFIMFLLFFPRGLIARRVADDVSPGEENKQDNGQSKGNVHGSQSRHAGSATGDGSPPGTVQMSPPTAFKKISYARVTVNATNPSARVTVNATYHSARVTFNATNPSARVTFNATYHSASVTFNATYHSPP